MYVYICVFVYVYICIYVCMYSIFQYILYVCRVLTVIHTYSSDALAQGILKSFFAFTHFLMPLPRSEPVAPSHIYVCMYARLCMYVCMCVNMCLYVCVRVRVCMYVCTYVCICLRLYVCTYI